MRWREEEEKKKESEEQMEETETEGLGVRAMIRHHKTGLNEKVQIKKKSYERDK